MRLPLILALLFAALVPATASADLRVPDVGATTLLSDVPQSRTWEPSIATDGNRTFVAYIEERMGVTVHPVHAAGSEVHAGRALQEWGTRSVEGPEVVVSGQHVYVAWIQGSSALSERHAVVAASHDGGRTWERPVRAGRPTGLGAWDLQLAADGDNVFVAYVDSANRIWTAGSRDGAQSFTCFATVTEPGDGAHRFDVAVDGQHVYWSWMSQADDVMVRRSKDAGRTLEPVAVVYEAGREGRPGLPALAADGGTVAIVFGQRFAMPREDGSGVDSGWEPRVAMSSDGGATWATKAVGGEATRCVDFYCADYSADVDGGRVYAGWRAKGQMWLARSEDGFAPRALGPYLYTWRASTPPAIDAHGDTVSTVWHSAPRLDDGDLDPVAAFSTDRGRTFALRTIDTGAAQDMFPVTAAWGPEPAGAGFAWWRYDAGDVKFAPLSAAEPDVAVEDVRPVQVAEDAARLASGRPTIIRTVLRAKGVRARAVGVEVELAYDRDGERVERTFERRIVVSPGLNTVQLLAEAPVVVGAGRITATVTVVPAGADADPANNTAEGSRAVVQPRSLRVLFVPIHAKDEPAPLCPDVQGVAEGTKRYFDAAWPVDPETFSVVSDCATVLTHPAGIDEAGLMDDGQLISRLDSLKFSAKVDKVIGVVPRGWFSRQRIAGFQNVIGIAPQGGGFDSGIVERQNTGGWIVAHELAHSLGQDHLNDTPAPGYWVAEKRDIADTTRDFRHHNTDGADVADTTGRWTSKATWDDLTAKLVTAPDLKRNVKGSDPFMFAVSGSVAGRAVKAGPAFELDGQAESQSGPFTAELLGADGAVLETQSFGPATDLGEVRTSIGAFSLRLPAHAAARTLRLRRGDEVLHTRTRSAAAPTVKVATPARAELGEDLKVTWEASDADGDTLTSLVSITTDGGRTWRSLGDATTEGERTVKAVSSLAGDGLRVRVTTTDGWNTTTSESGEFVIGGQATDGRLAISDLFSSYTVNADGTDLKRLETHGEIRWSPDGNRLASSAAGDLWVMNADGSDRRMVKARYGNRLFSHPVWAPEGDRLLVFNSTTASSLGDPRWVDLATGTETPFPTRGTPCEVTRDGSRVLLTGDRDYGLTRADGTEFVSLNPISGFECMSLSPDQRSGVVVGDNADVVANEIVLWDLQSKTMRNLTKGAFGQYNRCPRFAPSGEWIYWASSRDRGGYAFDIWKMRPDGTGAVKVLDGGDEGHSWACVDVQPRRGAAPEPTLEQRDPVARAAAASGQEGAPIALDATGSTPGADDAAITAYGWDLDGDGTYTDATGATPTATFPDEGTYTVSVLVTDARGRTATATSDITVENAKPVITEAQFTESGMLTAQIADGGATDTLTAELYWDREPGERARLIASGDGRYRIAAQHPGGATIVSLVVTDSGGASAEALATRVVVPANGAPTAADATAQTRVGESVDIALPAADPEGERLHYEVVDQPAKGSLQLRAESLDAGAPDVTYTAGEEEGPVTFSYRVSDGTGTSSVATVTVDVTLAPTAETPQPPHAYEATVPEPARTARVGTKPVDQRAVEQATAVKAADVLTFPSAKACVSRRQLTIHVKRGAYKRVVVHVNGKRVKVRNRAAGVDLRGLPKGRFKVTIAVTLKSGKVVKSTRQFRTCTAGNKTKKGGRS
ncbi:PKD domain-containing protein [Solirubrobacter taibaiensis]|nr:PKD domain-containing protein [Solirubrobacter taibaiensis]